MTDSSSLPQVLNEIYTQNLRRASLDLLIFKPSASPLVVRLACTAMVQDTIIPARHLRGPGVFIARVPKFSLR